MGDLETTDNWVDAFELSRFRGCRRRLFAPVHLNLIRSRTVGWGICIDSLILGPRALVRFYNSKVGDGSSVWLLPGEQLADVLDVEIGDDLDSVAIMDREPVQGEAGYARYLARISRRAASGGRGVAREFDPAA